MSSTPPPLSQTGSLPPTSARPAHSQDSSVRHVRRAARAIGPAPIPRSSTETSSARHTRSQSATPTGGSAPGTPTQNHYEAQHGLQTGAQVEQPPRRSTISVGTLQSPVPLSSSPSGASLNCPICGVMAPSLFALNMHLDDTHFAGAETGSSGARTGGARGAALRDGSGDASDGRSMARERGGAAQDDLDDVKGAILGFFRGAGKAVKGLGAIASAGPPSAASSDPGDDSPVAAATAASRDSRWRAGDRDGADRDLVTRAHWQQPKSGARCGLPACSVQLSPQTGVVNCRSCGRLMCSQHCMHSMRLSPTAQPSMRGAACRVCAECHSRSASAAGTRGAVSGASRDLTQSFVYLRRKAVGAAHLEGNRIEKRLEKLAIAHGSLHGPQQSHSAASSAASSVLQLSRGQSAIQVAEQMVVLWEDDAAVQSCPFCNKAFGVISSRRHHCRLCGRVVCHRPKCSALLTIPLPTADNRGFSADRCADIRACRDCEHIVLRQRDRAARSIPGALSGGELAALYDRIRETMRHVEETLPMFNTLALRIRSSTSMTPDLSRATRIRKQLTAAFNDLDKLSKRIAALPAPCPTSARLHSAIRQTVTQYLQLHMFPLTMLPKPERKQPFGLQSSAKLSGDRTPRVPTPLRTQVVGSQEPLGVDAAAATTAASVNETPSPATSIPSSVSTAIIANTGSDNSQRSGSSDSTANNQQHQIETGADRSAAEEAPKSLTSNVGGKASGFASSLLSYVVPRQPKPQEQKNSVDGGREELIRKALQADPGKESRIAAMAMDEKLATLEILRDQRQRVLGYISEAQRERRLEDAISLQSSLTDLDVELSLIERNL
ncbi:carboxypeptidase Y-deficient [Coemansia sp. RSA 2598]|nr:carboxypeptidase Y-deficient [Coemansia sp. RSA 2598]